MYLVTKWFGVFLCDEKGVKKKILFPKDEKEISKRLIEIDKNKVLSEEKKIIKNVKEQLVVNEKRLHRYGVYKPNDPFFIEFDIEPRDFGFSENLLHKAAKVVAEEKTLEELKSKDLQIIQMVNALDDLIQVSNLLSERLERWKSISASKKKIQPLENVFSMVDSGIKYFEKQIEDDMRDIAPNLTNIVGPLIGARLIAFAGGLKKLSSLPASTIQVLGAEKALFRYKKEGGKPPKHGVIFQHPYINTAPRKFRGKIARAMSSKISIAVKADVFTKRDIFKELKPVLDEKVKNIKNL